MKSRERTSDQVELAEDHSLLRRFIFSAKCTILSQQRSVQNFQHGIQKFRASEALSEQQVISSSRSPLWNENDNANNWILTAGKIENLRLAVQCIDGIVVPANGVFSFWKHIGYPGRLKGYVEGREIREGCIVPTIAGGLCQLSNALYEAAIDANFHILERHRHSKVIKGSLAEKDRDATVKWKHIDLRFSASSDFRIEAKLSANELIVEFKSAKREESNTSQRSNRNHEFVNDCFSCGNTACSKHSENQKSLPTATKTCYVLDEMWPEFQEYVTGRIESHDEVILCLKSNPLLKSRRYDWKFDDTQKQKILWRSGIRRALHLRQANKSRKNPFETRLLTDRKIAKRVIRNIPIEATHLVVSQTLLPFLHEFGALGGRSYDVLASRQSADEIQKQLDRAFDLHPDAKSLNDFRCDQRIRTNEMHALEAASSIVSPHGFIQKTYKNATNLAWAPVKTSSKQRSRATKILFPGSAMARKGAWNMRKLAIDLDLDLVVLKGKEESPEFWKDVKYSYFDGDLTEIQLIVYPTFVESQARFLLQAIEVGIPILCSEYCGLPESDLLIHIDSYNYEDIRSKVLHTLSK